VQPFDTLVDLLRWRAQERGPVPAYRWLEGGQERESHLTYAQLDLQACVIAAHLQECTRPGDRVLLVYPAGLEYIAGFFGCLYAGAVAVPVYPPRRNRSLERLKGVVQDAAATAALTTADVLDQVEARRAEAPFLGALRWLASDTLPAGSAGSWRRPALSGASLAFLQYTSGSTGVPRGVMLGHDNLLANERMIQERFRLDETLVAVGWLPLYHDMGLIGNVLQTLYVGGQLVQMAPSTFLQHPSRWLEAISRYRATISGAPNFAYDLCSERTPPQVRDALDLSSWRVAFVGAEPIRAATLERFALRFAACGFRRSAFLCCYGLAEATLFLTGSHAARILPVEPAALAQARVVPVRDGTGDSHTLVASGRPALDTEIVIVEPGTNELLPPGRVGEIWARGPQVGRGYWGNPGATQAVFGARLGGAGPFLRTGDLGFLHDGELFVTGRQKDLVIVDGRNHYPQDIEWTVERSHPALRSQGAVAFSVEQGGAEHLVVVQELERNRLAFPRAEILAAIRRAVADEHDLALFDVQLLRPGAVPKTSSGKNQRSLCRQLYLRGGLGLAPQVPQAALATS
jgi:acyl-CoA synthetase (AMP-forming)/AMP-acid ligase II